jgi:Spy/CpxP family protein refolding chaperone
MRAFWWSWLVVFSTAIMVTLCAAQDTSPVAGNEASQPFTRTVAPDPSLPPVSMLVRLLSMTPEQEQKVRQLFAAHNQRYGEVMQQNLPPKERQEKLRELRRNLQKGLEGVLTPQQLQKLRNLQPEAMLVDRLTVALRLTQEQSEQLLEVLREQSAGIRAIEKEAEEKKWGEQQRKEKLAELRKQIDEKVKKILTPEQQQKLKQILQGEGTPAQIPSGNQQPPAP